MSKFICMCGITFHKQKDSVAHLKMYDDLSGVEFPRHKVFKRKWSSRAIDYFFKISWDKLLRFVGLYIIFFTVKNHFSIDLNWIESLFIGLGIGVYIK